MKTNNLTPMPVGTRVTSRNPGRLEMTVIVRGKFRLAHGEPLVLVGDPNDPLVQGFMSADLFDEADDERVGESLSPSDFADYKPHAEALFRGSCYPPGGAPVTECSVRMSVGDWSKSLRVVGRRVFSDSRAGAALSQALPFTEMSITWANAFGGPPDEQNPVGKGLESTEAPNLEPLGGPSMTTRGARIPSVSLGPINPLWEVRRQKVGANYGDEWRKTRAPFYSDDFDWTHFQSAPPDQWMPYLRGNEAISFFNLHPKHALLEAKLPGLSAKAFVLDTLGSFREVKLNLDTLFANLDDDAVYLTWRGLCEVREDDLKDIDCLLVATEPLEDPKPESTYRALMDAFVDDPLGIEAAKKRLLPAEPEGHQEKMAAFNAFRASFDEAANNNDPDAFEKAALGALKLVGGKEAEALSAELPAKFAALKEKTKEHNLEPVGSGFAASAKKPAPKVDLRKVAPGQAPAIGAPEMASSIQRLKAELPAIEAQMKEANIPADAIQQIQQIQTVLEHPMLANLGKEPPADVPPAAGADLSGMDLRGRDLRGADLSGCTMTGTDLSGANLAGARLVGAKLERALLPGANLSGANLSRAEVVTSVLTGLVANDLVMRDATIDRSTFDGSNLRLADFSGTTATMVLFMSADMSGFRAHRARFQRCMWNEGKLDDADVEGSTFEFCLVRGSSARRSSWKRARLQSAGFLESDIAQSTFESATGEVAVFLGSKLPDTSFRYADLFRSHFTDSELERCDFTSADLRGSRFYRAQLVQANFEYANLIRADLSKAHLERARFQRANLYDAKFIRAYGAKADFLDANLKRALLERT